jgi:dienelactone hydrolase
MTRLSWLATLGMPVVVLLAGCAGPASSTTPEPSAEGTAAMTASPPPAASHDPASLGTLGEPPAISVRGTETADGVTTQDITFARDGIPQTEAYLVLPAADGGAPAEASLGGTLWLHWLETGSPTSNRTEFLEEARELARSGVVSLLVQGTFPWNERPASLAHDLAAVEADVRMLRGGLDLLAAQPGVDGTRIVAVGHDFGGMYASVVFGTDERLSGLVVMAPTARWGDWFLRYWPIADAEEEYLAAMGPVDPVTWLAEADGRPILLQFGSDDQYVPEQVAAEISAAAGDSSRTLTYDAGHDLDDEAARADRDAWLAEQLRLDAD